MQQHSFSDREIEDYLDGVFEGDHAALQDYLENTSEGRQRLAAFQALYSALGAEEEPVLSISLSAAVMDKLATREAKKKSAWNSIVWIAGTAAGAVLLFYCFQLAKDFSLPSEMIGSAGFIFVVIIMAVGLAAFQWVDLHRMKERYKLTSRTSNA